MGILTDLWKKPDPSSLEHKGFTNVVNMYLWLIKGYDKWGLIYVRYFDNPIDTTQTCLNYQNLAKENISRTLWKQLVNMLALLKKMKQLFWTTFSMFSILPPKGWGGGQFITWSSVSLISMNCTSKSWLDMLRWIVNDCIV